MLVYDHFQTQQDYIRQYVDRIDEFLEAQLSHESMPEGAGLCRHCNIAIAVWRCKDCVLATPLCRSCMRRYHRENPFHRIQQWNGSFFRSAELWEVGTYLLIRHNTGVQICDTLRHWCGLLESAEKSKDSIEQENLNRYNPAPAPVPDVDDMDMDMDMDFEDEGDVEEDVDEDDEDISDEDDEDYETDNNTYLNVPGTGTTAGIDPALAAATHGAYVRVVHTNGLHHIAMVSCQCHGKDVLPLDLFASQLLPASLNRIKTLFTAQVLDSFRLCNLELKASAYQYYHLLRRLTRPMEPAAVLNLYREFRRMTRIWRWMKKLKWAGYAGSPKPVHDVKAGDLAIFCPACPQPGINIPDNWKDDTARYSLIFFFFKFLNLRQIRWVYKRIFVADGNFKADHVRQKNEVGDVWLSEGSGMIPKREEYFTFLATAIERLTVSARQKPAETGIK